MAVAASLFGACLLLAAALVDGMPYHKSEGEPCGDGLSRGICRRVSSCEAARRAIDSRRPMPKRCGFLGYEEVVCCPEELSSGDDNGIDFGGNGVSDEDDRRGGQGAGRDSWNAHTGSGHDDSWSGQRGNSRGDRRRDQGNNARDDSWNGHAGGTREDHGQAGGSREDTWKGQASGSHEDRWNGQGGVRDDDPWTGQGSGSRGDRPSTRPKSSIRRSDKACNSYKDFIQHGPSYHILEGIRTQIEEFPHMAALGFRMAGVDGLSWLCGGSLISDQYVLTAAHCCSNSRWKGPSKVQLGTLNLTKAAPGEFQFGVKEVIIHPEYKKPSYHHDIALLKLDRKVNMSDRMMPACLYTKSGNPAGKFTATGWGATNAIGTRSSSVLLKTSISSVPMSECEKKYRNKFPEGFDATVVCAGDPAGVTDTCGGDSGGPLQVKETSDIYSIVGVTSLGPNPCGGSIPSIYTRVSSHLDWIENIVWG